MKILVVHDRPEVAAAIASIAGTAVTGADIEVAEDGSTARHRLAAKIYDLLIIDLTLPHMKGAKSDYRVADELLKELFSLDTFNVPGDVIGLTKEPDALDSVNNSLGPHVMVTILEDTEGRWRTYLSDKIRYASRAAVTRQISINRHYLYDALIITALDKEFAPYKSAFDLTPVKHFPGAYEFMFADKDDVSRKGIGYSIGKSGQARAASATQSLLVAFRPRLALMSGFCGGVKTAKVALGDLMIFDTVYDWDYGKWEESDQADGAKASTFLSRPTPISIDGTKIHRQARALKEAKFNKTADLLEKVELLSKGALREFDIHIAPGASGSAVVTDESVVARIRGLNDSIRAVDMECYGFYFACSQTQVVAPEFICMKSSADFCNGDKGDDLHAACSNISASAAITMLTRRWSFVEQ